MVKEKMSRKIYLILLLFVFVLIFASTATASTSLTYEYDANGNLISGDGKYYEYNDANQLVRVKHGDQNGPVIAEYFYDYTGQRIKKIENGVTTYYIGKHFEKQVDSTGSASMTSYYFANGERVAKKDAFGNIFYYHSDHLGGTNVVTDSSGNLIERIKYYPFGEMREGGNEKYSFTGKEKDKLTDNYYFEARYYNPEFKHFTQADTVSLNLYDPQDLNRYAYVSNNPLRYIDPTGHVWWNPFTWFKKSDKNENQNEIQNNSNKTATNQCIGPCRSNPVVTQEKQTYIRQHTPNDVEQANPQIQLDVNQQMANFNLKSGESVKRVSFDPNVNPDFSTGQLADGQKVAIGTLKTVAGVAAVVSGATLISTGFLVGGIPLTIGCYGVVEGVGDIYSGVTGRDNLIYNPFPHDPSLILP